MMATSRRIGVEKTWCPQCGIHYCVHYIIILWSKALASIQEVLPYSAKLSRGKTFTNFVVWNHPWKFCPWNLGMPYPPMTGFSIPRKFSPRNGHLLPICESFLPQKFPTIQYYMYWPRFMYYNPQTTSEDTMSCDLRTYIHTCITATTETKNSVSITVTA